MGAFKGGVDVHLCAFAQGPQGVAGSKDSYAIGVVALDQESAVLKSAGPLTLNNYVGYLTRDWWHELGPPPVD